MEYPKPSVNTIPNWYKNLSSKVIDSKAKLRFADFGNKMGITTNATLKKCIPFFDAMTNGYVIQLPCDIEITKTNEGITWKWLLPEVDNLISVHNDTSYDNFVIPKEFENYVLKWKNYFSIQTPSGYSVLFTHPQNRLDLPFYTFSGLVDTDTYYKAVQFPFLLKKMTKENIVIPEGTPIAQVILIKNEPWISEHKEYNRTFEIETDWNFYRFISAYKNKFWKRKSFK